MLRRQLACLLKERLKNLFKVNLHVNRLVATFCDFFFQVSFNTLGKSFLRIVLLTQVYPVSARVNKVIFEPFFSSS